ncbi:MAG: ABC transporter permease, partial [Bacilli bacterium]
IFLYVYSLVWMSVGFVFTSLIAHKSTSNVLSQTAVTLTSMVGGCFVSVNNLPASMQTISYFTPQRWLIDSVVNSLAGTNIPWSNLGLLLLYTLMFLSIAAYLYGRKEKMRTAV